jgi:hypothetical protein
MEHRIVYTTALVFEVDTIREAFKKSDIPFYLQSESLAGVRVAFEVLPAAGLGRRWHVFVPSNFEAKAKKLLSTLHLTVDSDSKPFFIATKATFKRGLLKALIILSPVFALMAYFFYKALTKH